MASEGILSLLNPEVMSTSFLPELVKQLSQTAALVVRQNPVATASFMCTCVIPLLHSVLQENEN